MQHNIRGVSRRTVLMHAGVVAAATAVTSLTPSVATAGSIEAPKTAPANVPTSANGWPLEKEANHVSTVWTRPVPGTGLKLDIRIGDAEAILLHVIRRFHYEVEPLHSIDLAGWRSIDSLNKSLPESNLASGTAVRIRPGASAKGSLFPSKRSWCATSSPTSKGSSAGEGTTIRWTNPSSTSTGDPTAAKYVTWHASCARGDHSRPGRRYDSGPLLQDTTRARPAPRTTAEQSLSMPTRAGAAASRIQV